MASVAVEVGLFYPGLDRLSGGLELFGQGAWRASGADQLDHLLAKFLVARDMSKGDLVDGFSLAKRSFVAFIGKCPSFPGQLNERLLAVRRRKTDFQRRVNGDVAIEFGVVALCRVTLRLLVIGGRRLHHLKFVQGDGLLQRFCGLQHLPSDRSVIRGLRRFGASSVEALRQLNAAEVARVVGSCVHARTLTIDVDGTVLCTGSKVGGAARGYNPHHRKVPSYYPVTAFTSYIGECQ